MVSSRTPILLTVVAACLIPAGLGAAEWGDLRAMPNFRECFSVPEAAKTPQYRLTMLASNAPGNVYHPREQPSFTFQLENLTDRPIKTRGRVDLVRYAQSGRPGEMWWPDLRKLEELPSTSVEVELAPRAWRKVTIEPRTPETKGGYGLVVDLGPHGRAYLTSYVRTFKPAMQRVQFPKQSLEEMPPAILARLGVQAVRWGISYEPTDSTRFAKLWTEIAEELQDYHAHLVTVVAEVGGGSAEQPLGRGRPHMDDGAVMLGGKEDLVWLPKYDDDYQQFVYRLVSTFGWPKGPITGVKLWNEPWEGLSISGWGADMVRYRELYRRMGEAVFRARKEAGVDVLVGGCDSSANTWDKLFGDGSEEFLPYLDFCSIHYQGLFAPVLHPLWNNRTCYKGRVLIWDTESWVANSDDRFAGVVAANRAAGYDRSMGTLSRIAVSTLSHRRTAKDKVRTDAGQEVINRHVESRPMAAAYGAVQHFIGERAFQQIVFTNGLPWVFAFDGLEGNPDDGTVVIVGDIASLFQKGEPLFNGVCCLDEVRQKQAIREELARLASNDPRQAELRKRLAERMPLSNASLTLEAAGQPFGIYDFYGNAVPATGGKIVVPLNERSCFLRADPQRKGSFDALVQAIRRGQVRGLEPLEIIAYDMTSPVEKGPVLRLRLTSMHNQPIAGTLGITLGGLEVTYPRQLDFAPRQQKWVEVQVRGRRRADNTYPLSVVFNAGPAGIAAHHEDMHVNWIMRRTIRVDGRLDDWQGAIPQVIRTGEAAGQSFDEAMYLPFEKPRPGITGGFAVGYLAYDDRYFYFAARIADDTPHAGVPRFATRDENADFYPEVCYSRPAERGRPPRSKGEPELAPAKEQPLLKHVWPQDVRRFSYRRWPDVPSGMPQHPYDNVLLGFNAIEPEQKDWLTHLPGRMPKFVGYKTTDYEYALNKVADQYGGGTEIWRLLAPGMPYKHFFPRQPKHPLEGAVPNGRLEVRYENDMRIVECSLPWSEIPHVKRLLDAGKPLKFSFRVNHAVRSPDMELAMHRSAAEGISHCFHPNWIRSWPNELEFAFEGK